jgi:hypothetical protein
MGTATRLKVVWVHVLVQPPCPQRKPPPRVDPTVIVWLCPLSKYSASLGPETAEARNGLALGSAKGCPVQSEEVKYNEPDRKALRNTATGSPIP